MCVYVYLLHNLITLWYRKTHITPITIGTAEIGGTITGNILHKLFFGLSKNQQITYEIPLYDQVPSYIFFSLADVGTLSKSLRKTTFEYFWLARACPGLLMMSLSILIILHTQPCHAWYYALTAGVVMEKWIHT